MFEFYKTSVKYITVPFLFIIVPFCGWGQQTNAEQKTITTLDFIEDTTQKVDVIDIVKSKFKLDINNNRKNAGKKIYFSLLPVSSVIPGGGKALITSTSAGFYLGNRRNTFLSSVTFSPYLNFKGRYAISFRSNLFTSKNLYNILGDTRFSLYPQFTYGSKRNNQQNNRILVNYKYIRFYQTLLKRVRTFFLAGAGYNLDYHIGIKTINDTIGLAKFTGYNYGTAYNQNSFSSGINFNLLYDRRYNSVNPLPGEYANIIYRINPGFLGSDQSWSSLYLDYRKYLSFPSNKRKMLGFWSYAWMTLNKQAPYLDLPSIGWDPNFRSGRGVDQNRYRGKDLFYVEAEYRKDITLNGLLGYVLFANFNTVTGPADSRISAPHPAAGGGLRIKFNKKSDTNIAFDYGVSKGYWGIYLNLGETF